LRGGGSAFRAEDLLQALLLGLRRPGARPISELHEAQRVAVVDEAIARQDRVLPLGRARSLHVRGRLRPRHINGRKWSRMLVPANVGFQEENSAPEGLERDQTFASAKRRLRQQPTFVALLVS
jgi:hypothetical protein